jgi:hypothetical protein
MLIFKNTPMKNIIKFIAFSSLVCICFTSCEDMFGDYLEKAPGVDVTIDTIFSSVNQANKAVSTAYWFATHSTYPYEDPGGGNDGWFGAVTDEGECIASWFQPNGVNRGDITPTWNRDWRWATRNKACRYTNIVIERIVDVPDASEDYKKQVIAEMKFLRALNNFYTFQHYGGIPLFDASYKIGDDHGKVARSSLEETVNFIVKDCDDAIAVLPDAHPSNMKGRATKAAAMMLKSRTLLYAASPLFNTATPYIELPGHNHLICYGNYDVNRWQKAADAAKAVIDYAPSAGIALITDKGIDKNYQYIWAYQDNKEVILAARKNDLMSNNAMAIFFIGARPFYSGLGGNTGTLNFISMYEKRDGTPVEWDFENGGDDLIEKYESMDLRFKQSWGYSGGYWNEDYPYCEIWEGGRHVTACTGGTWLQKMLPPQQTKANPRIILQSPTFRLTEAYLNYAEALNEAKGPVPEAHAAINKIRNRSGQPNLPTGLTQEEFRNKIRNERAIELLNEEHRMWDLRRWLLAESTTYGGMNGPIIGMKIYKISDNPLRCRYVPTLIENRVFHRQHYLYPWRQNEVYKGYLIQNPGY